MKTILLKIAFLAIILFVVSCNEEQVTQKEDPIIDKSISSESLKNDALDVAQSSGGYICIYIFERGLRIYSPYGGYDCLNVPVSFCRIFRKICFPLYYECIFCDIPLVFDPWELIKYVDPLEIPDLREKLEVEVDVKTQMIPFAVNESVIGMQFYAPVEGIVNESVMTLKGSFDLDEEMVQEFGLKGNVVPEGEYPVAFNEETQVYTALLSVK